MLREKLRANPAQSKNQIKVTVSGIARDNPEGFGNVYIIAAPDGPRDVNLKADEDHKALYNLYHWCMNPKNKNKGEDDYKPSTTTISNASTAIEVIHECLDAGRSAETLDAFFRGSGRIAPSDRSTSARCCARRTSSARTRS